MISTLVAPYCLHRFAGERQKTMKPIRLLSSTMVLAPVLLGAWLTSAPIASLAAGANDPATAEEVQRQMEGLAKALTEARKAGMTAQPPDAADVQDLQALTEALTGISGQLAGAMAGDTTAEPDLQLLLRALQQQAARQQALQKQPQSTPSTTP